MITLRGKLIRTLVEQNGIMITLRGKLIRTLVERKAAPPSDIDLPQQIVQEPRSSPASDPNPKRGNEAKTAAELDSMGLMEEWTWRGVWAFGDLEDEPSSSAPKKEDNRNE